MTLYVVVCTPVAVTYAVQTDGMTVQIRPIDKSNLFVACIECLYIPVYELVSRLKGAGWTQVKFMTIPKCYHIQKDELTMT